METGSIPTASTHGTWFETAEVWAIDTDTLFDLSGVTEIILKLRDPRSHFDELTLTMSGGNIVVPSTGIIQWRVEAGQMGALDPKLYEIILILEDETDILVMILGSVSIVE